MHAFQSFSASSLPTHAMTGPGGGGSKGVGALANPSPTGFGITLTGAILPTRRWTMSAWYLEGAKNPLGLSFDNQ
jgi:hypothetical protein